MKYAFAGALVSAAGQLLIFTQGLQQTKAGGLMMLLPMAIAVLVVLLSIKDSHATALDKNGAYFKTDLKKGMQGAAMFAVFAALFIFIYYRWIDVTFFEKKIFATLELMKEKGMSETEREDYLKSARFIFTPQKQAFFFFFVYMLTGLTSAVFISLGFNRGILKRF